MAMTRVLRDDELGPQCAECGHTHYEHGPDGHCPFRSGLTFRLAEVEVVESREPFPSDEDAWKALRELVTAIEQSPDGRLTMRQRAAIVEARAVLDAVSSHRDEDSAGAECSRLEDDMLEIHDALVDAGLPGTINAQNILERINALASHRDDEVRDG